MEVWKNIIGFEGYYEISNLGEVRSIFYNKGKLNSKLKQTNRNNGYMFVILYKNGVKHNKNIHRLVAESFILNPEKKEQVNHINGIKSDNKVENLEWNTMSENMIHAFKNGLMNQSCDKNGNSKLTREQVFNIKYGIIKGSQRKIAKELGVSKSIIGLIKLGKVWQEI
jgi:hypothetical protein